MDFTTFHNIVDGQLHGSETTYHGTSPENKASLWPCPIATADDVELAVLAAQKAQPGWAKKSYKERTQLLTDFSAIYLSHADEFCQLLAAECGRTVANAAIEVHWAAQWLTYPASYDLPEKRIEDDKKVAIITHEPLGLVATICPWNFPLMLAIGKLAPALATGNCVIMKPSPFAPYTALKLAELANKVFPPGVVQALGGRDQDNVGPMLVEHPGIQKISFTGSTATGKKVLEAAAKHMKRVTLETAGNNAAIVMADVSVDSVCPQIAGGSFFNAGQVCIAPRRIYIQEQIFDVFVKALAATTAAMAQDLAGNIGPLQNEMQFAKIVASLEECKKQGLEFVVGGSEVSDTKGFLLKPTIVKNPPETSRIVTNESFGPIISCIQFSSVDDAVRLANGNDSGLAASIWAQDISVAQDIASRLDVGNVFVNGPPQPDPNVPFGGHKQSGLGVEYGLEGLLSFCQIKSVYLYK